MSSKPISLHATAAPATLSRVTPWATNLSILLSDLAAISLVYWAAVIARYLTSPGYELIFYFELSPLLMLLFAAFATQALYPGLLLHPADEMRKVFYSVCFTFLIIMSATFFWRNAEEYSRSVVLVTWALATPAVLFGRYSVRRTLSRQPWWGVSAVIFGSGASAQRILKTLRQATVGVRIDGVFTDEEAPWTGYMQPNLARHSSETKRRANQYAIVAMTNKSSAELRHAIQDHCRGFRHVLLVPDMAGICSMGIAVREIGGELGFEVPQRLFHLGSAIIKRTLDIAISAMALVALSPLLSLIAVATKLTSRGTILYGHTRYGRNGNPFKALKFRTMVSNADQVLAAHLSANPVDLAEWLRDRKLKKDPRVTTIGKWLRRYSLDETPQLINVMLGQMSLVGPRPIVSAEIEKYGRGFSLYTRVRPGITGLWQVSGRNNTTYQERVAYDEYYVHNWSVWLDTYILIRTIRVVVTGHGAY